MAIDEKLEKIFTPEGTLEVGERDPLTGQRFERFDPKITTESLKPEPPIDFQTLEETPIFPVATLTPTEEQAQEKTEDISSLTEQLIGESAFTAEQETTQGLPALQQTQTDLSARLKALSNEALAIPLQLQQEAEGRGITAGGLRPLQTARLRENAIQALSVNSLLEASRGNITMAQDMVDRAVAQKYNPIREAIAVKTANLSLILQSPQFNLEQKNRAQAQLDIQNAKLKEANQAEAEETAIKNIAIQAAQQGVSATDLSRIQGASSEVEANRIAASLGVFEAIAEVDTQIIESGGKKLLINTQTGETIKDLGVSEVSDFKFISGTKEQEAGAFNPTTGEFTPLEEGMRTDRHFNPIAVSDAKVEWQNILQQAGISFSIGDEFPENPNLHTLTFPDAETGIQASQVLLGNSDAFYWYKNQTGKQVLQDINSPDEFKALSDEEQRNIVQQIYQNEGGTGELFGISGEPLTEEERLAAVKNLSPLAKSIWDGVLDIKDITPTQRAEIAPELNKAGWSKAVANEQKSDFSTTKSGLDATLASLRLVPNKYKGYLQGGLASIFGVGLYNPEVATFNADKGIVGMQLTRLFEKGRISDADRDFYMSLMPNLRMTEKSAEAATNELKLRLDEKLKANIRKVNEFVAEPSEEQEEHQVGDIVEVDGIKYEYKGNDNYEQI